MTNIKYVAGSNLPDLSLAWYNAFKQLVDFSVGYTYQLKIGRAGEAALITKTTGFTGASGDPNLVVAWNTGDGLHLLDPGVYLLQITATRTADSRLRKMTRGFEVTAGVL